MTQATPPARFDRLPESLREPLTQYSARIQELCGPAALGLAAYGRAALDGFDPLHRGIHNVLVLRQVDLDLLRRLAPEGSRFGKHGIASPLIMTPEYIAASCDSYPLELIEIQAQHVTLFGAEYFDSLQFLPPHVRSQCEREIKSMLVGLHRGLLTSEGHEDRLSRLSHAAAAHLVRVLTGLLWLTGRRNASKVFDVVAGAESLIGRKLPGVYAALDDSRTAGWHQFRALYADLQALEQYADGLETR